MMKLNPHLSIVIITRNEEADLPECLDSVRDLNAEIVIVDNHSEDRTLEIARRYTEHIHTQAFVSYAEQKQSALDRASGKWVLSIDADERITPELRDEILEVTRKNPTESGFVIPYEVYFMGRRLRFGGLGSEKHLRLFRGSHGHFIGGKLHEGIEVQGPIGRLKGRMRHIPYRDLDEYLAKMSRYTSLSAQKRLAAGKHFTPLHLLLPFWEFFVRAVLRLGVLDGVPGISWAGLSSLHTGIKYLKLRQLEINSGTISDPHRNRPSHPPPPTSGRGRTWESSGSKIPGKHS